MTADTPPRSVARQQLVAEGLCVRPCRADDVDQVYRAAIESLAELRPWFPWCHPEYTRDACAAWLTGCGPAWDEGREYAFLITRDAARGGENELLGVLGFNQIDWTSRRANMGYWVRTSAAGHGIASAAALLIARFGFEQLRLERIEIVADVRNAASQRVAEKIGAQRESIARRRLRVAGLSHDAVVYSLLPDDLPPRDA